VNYKGSGQTFKSQLIETNESVLTVNLDDLGYMNIAVKAGDINFDQVTKAVVSMRYEDAANNIPLFEDEFTIDKDHPEHTFEKLLLVPVKNPYRYQVKYFMKGGKEYEVKERESNSKTLFIEDPFVDIKDVMIRASGDLETDINSITLDLEYEEAANDYRQNLQVQLNKGNSFATWSIPVIDSRAGKITYSGTISYKNGLSEDIPATVAERNSIVAGPQIAKVLSIQVIPDLIDFGRVKLAKVSLHYTDPANDIDESKDCIFKAGDTVPPFVWNVNLKDKQKSDYTWQASYFFTDGTSRKTDEVSTDEQTLVLETPA
jgi:hypothetical protein